MIGDWADRIEAVWQGAQRLFPAKLKLYWAMSALPYSLPSAVRKRI